jgi:hypothetical protein
MAGDRAPTLFSTLIPGDKSPGYYQSSLTGLVQTASKENLFEGEHNIASRGGREGDAERWA